MKKDCLKIIGVGLLAGVVSGFFSSGGGMLLVPFFTHILKIICDIYQPIKHLHYE